MSLLQVENVCLSIGGPLLLDHVDLTVDTGERVALIGRNGAGKSTLLRLIAGRLAPEEGSVQLSPGRRVAMLDQEVGSADDACVFDTVAAGIEGLGEDLALYHRLTHAPIVDTAALAPVHERIEAVAGWDAERRVEETLSRLSLDGDAPFASLSGGMRRRVMLARALVAEPDLLLLDEPTNHLDIESIEWLEGFLEGWQGALVFVTHDRRFLRRLATRIVEIDRGKLTSWPGDWDNYQRRSAERANAESLERSRFDKFLAQEETWIRQGIKARRTRDEGRVRRLEAMRRERADRREGPGQARIEASRSAASGRKVIEVRNLDFGFGARRIVSDFSTVILRGDRVGLIGANGSGKTTLLRVLLGELAPDNGEVRAGTRLDIAYFDQQRATLREDWNALENVAEGLEFVEVNGRRKHALGYLQDFLFTPERARAPITRLSGGERNRLLLARLFARPSNLLVMDEPTNDLDVETLELLEELLAEYEGTLLLVSHDRDFLDRVVTSTLVMEGDGTVGEYVGGYSDWLRQRRRSASASPEATRDPPARTAEIAATAPVANVALPPVTARKRKLGFRENRELESLPATIDRLESRVAELARDMQSPDYYRRPKESVTADQFELTRTQAELDAALARWMELEEP